MSSSADSANFQHVAEPVFSLQLQPLLPLISPSKRSIEDFGLHCLERHDELTRFDRIDVYEVSDGINSDRKSRFTDSGARSL